MFFGLKAMAGGVCGGSRLIEKAMEIKPNLRTPYKEVAFGNLGGDEVGKLDTVVVELVFGPVMAWMVEVDDDEEAKGVQRGCSMKGFKEKKKGMVVGVG